MTLASFTTTQRKRVNSFSSDSSDSDADALDTLELQLQAESAAAANARQKRRMAAPVEETKLIELDHISETLYERIEEDAMMEIMASLEEQCAHEFACAASKQTEADSFHWDLLATPAMMMQFSQAVATAAVRG